MSLPVFCPFCDTEYNTGEFDLFDDGDEVTIDCNSCHGSFSVTLELMQEYNVRQLKNPPKEKMEELGLSLTYDDCPGQMFLFDTTT
jgi:hypothetical protein